MLCITLYKWCVSGKSDSTNSILSIAIVTLGGSGRINRGKRYRWLKCVRIVYLAFIFVPWLIACDTVECFLWSAERARSSSRVASWIRIVEFLPIAIKFLHGVVSPLYVNLNTEFVCGWRTDNDTPNESAMCFTRQVSISTKPMSDISWSVCRVRFWQNCNWNLGTFIDYRVPSTMIYRNLNSHQLVITEKTVASIHILYGSIERI